MSMRKVSVRHILSGGLGWGIQVRSIIPFALFCCGLAIGGHLRKEQPFLTSDLHGDLHFLSNSTNEIISTLVYKQRKTVFQKTIIVCRCFQFFREENNGDFCGSKASMFANAKISKVGPCSIVW